MSKPAGLTHILTELSSLDDLSALLRRSARLKYTCISASKKYLALGSNTGGVYIFSRETLKYQQVVYADSNSSPITSIRLSPTSQHIATAASTGHVNVFELNIDCRSKPERVRGSFDHTGRTVTVMTWASTGQKLFVGDDTGKLSVIFVPNKKTKTLFKMPTEVIAYLDASIFQMGWWDNKLLVSSLTNCYLFDTNRHNYSSIGSKKRDGAFGACIFLEPASLCPVIYCARPGSRIWEVDFDGKVLNTHLFKQLLAVPPVPTLNIMSDTYSPSEIETQGSQSVSFSKMIPLGSLILTWSSKGLYLLDPINVKVIVWTDSILGIRDIALYGNDVYLFLESSSVRRLTLLSVYPLFQLLAGRARWSLMSCLLLSSDQINLHASIVKRVRKDLFEPLVNGLRESGKKDMVEKLYAMMDDVSESSINSVSLGEDFMGSAGDDVMVMGHMTLPSGMVVVSEGFSADWTTERDYDVMMSDVEAIDGDDDVDGGGDDSDGDDDGGGGRRQNSLFTEDGIEKNRTQDGGRDAKGWDDEKARLQNHKSLDGENTIRNGDGEEGDVFVKGEVKSDSVLYEDSVEVINDDESDRTCGGGEEYGDGNGERKNLTAERGGSNGEVFYDSYDGKNDTGCGNSSLRADEYVAVVGGVEASSGVQEKDDCGVDECTERDIQHSKYTRKEEGVSHENDHRLVYNEECEMVDDEANKVTLLEHKNGFEESESSVNRKIKDLNNGGGDCVLLVSPSNGNVSTLKDSPTGLEPIGNTLVKYSDERKEFKSSSISNDSSQAITNFDTIHDIPQPDTSLSESSPILPNDGRDRGEWDVISDSHNTRTQNSPASEEKASVNKTDNSSSNVCGESLDGDVDEAGLVGHCDISSQHSTTRERLDSFPSLDSGAINTARRFSNVEIKKGETDIIAKAVRKTKKKKKKASTIDLQDRNMQDYLRKSMLRSASCDDLVQVSLYNHWAGEKDADSISISTIDSIEEDDKEDVRRTMAVDGLAPRLSPSSSSGRDTGATMGRGVVRNHSFDVLSLSQDSDLSHLHRRSMQSSIYHEERSSQGQGHQCQVIPPLIDRLAAAKGSSAAAAGGGGCGTAGGSGGGSDSRRPSRATPAATTTRDGLSGNTVASLTDSGEFSAIMSQLPSSLSAMKDGLSMKLKNQTRHFIKSFKEKNPLNVKSSTSPLLQPSHATKKVPQTKDSSSAMANQSDEPTHPGELSTEETRKLPKEDRERLLLEKAAAAEVKDELESLYKKAVYIQTAVKTSNLAMQPVMFKSVLNQWCRDLNAVMHKFLVELKRRQNEKENDEIENEKKKRLEMESDCNVDFNEEAAIACDFGPNVGNHPQLVESVETDTLSNAVDRTVLLHNDDPIATTTSISMSKVKSHNSNGTNGSPSTTEENFDHNSDSHHLPTSHHQHHHPHHHHPHHHHLHHHHVHHPPNNAATDKDQDFSPVLLFSEILHVSDPLHLTSKQRQAFHDLCTLCFLSGSTGNIFNTFQMPEQYQHNQRPVLESVLPTHLQTSFIRFRNSQRKDSFFLSTVLKNVSKELLNNNNGVSNCPCQYFSCDKESLSNTKIDNVSISVKSRQSSCPLQCYRSDDDGNTSSRSEAVTCNQSPDNDLANGEGDEVGIVMQGNEQNAEVGESPLTTDQMEDLESAMFLRVFFFLLDYDLVKQYLNGRGSSKFLTWSSLISCCHEKGKSDIVSSLLSDRQTNAAIDYLRSGILMHPQALIGHLYRLFQYTPSKAAEFCSEVQSSVTAQEVIALCILSDKSPTEPFLRYIKKCVIDLPFFQRSSEFGILCDEPVIRLLLLHALLPSSGSNSKKENTKRDGQDLAASVISVIPSDWLEQIISRVTSLEEQDLVLHLCLTLRQWKPCIQLMSKMDDKKPLLDLLVTVGDMDLISENGYIPQTTEEWRLLLTCFLQNQKTLPTRNEGNHPTTKWIDSSTTGAINEKDDSPQTLNGNSSDRNDLEMRRERDEREKAADSSMAASKQEVDRKAADGRGLPLPTSPMTMESLTSVLVHHLGGAAAVEMMCQKLCCVGGSDDEGSDQVPLTSKMLEACLSDFSMEAEQTQVCHEMLERLSVYMWAKKSGFLPPSVGHVIRAETKSKDGGPKVLEENLACDRQISLLQSTSSTVLMSENFGVHWGQEVNMNQTCQSCQMPLRQIVSHDSPGVVLFPCGDAFHKKCCAGSFCPILH